MAHSGVVRLVSVIAGLVALGCSPSNDDDPVDPPDPPDPPVETSVDIGTPPPDDDLGFAPLETNDELHLQSFGQGGTHALFSIRCVGFGNRAYITISITNLNTGNAVMSPTPARPQLLLCDEARVICDLVPLLVMTGGLTDPDEERDGLPVRVTAEVTNDDDDKYATSDAEAVLRTDWL